MIDLQFLRTLPPLDTEKKQEIESVIYGILYDPKVSENFFNAWHDFFKKQNFSLDLIRDTYDSYWKWYTIVSWQHFFSRTPDQISEIVSTQFAMAFRLGFDVSNLYRNFLIGSIPDESVQNSFHAAIVNSIKDFNYPYDYHGGKNMLSLVKDIQDATSLDIFERSALYADIEKFLFQEPEFELYSSDKKVERIRVFFQFIGIITDTRSVADLRIQYLNTATYLSTSVESVILGSLGFNFLRSNEERQKNSDFVEDNTIFLGGKKKKRSLYYEVYLGLLRQLSSLSEDEKDEYIITRLMELSEEYQDEKIRDLYYYDDEMDVFTWNEEFLRQDELENQ